MSWHIKMDGGVRQSSHGRMDGRTFFIHRSLFLSVPSNRSTQTTHSRLTDFATIESNG
jgi:hypothetical protein